MPSRSITVLASGTFAPIAGARVRVGTVNEILEGFTDSSGNVTLTGDYFALSGTSNLTIWYVEATGYLSRTVNTPSNGDLVMMTAGTGYAEVPNYGSLTNTIAFGETLRCPVDIADSNDTGGLYDWEITLTDRAGTTYGPYSFTGYGAPHSIGSLPYDVFMWEAVSVGENFGATPLPAQTIHGFALAGQSTVRVAFAKPACPPDGGGPDPEEALGKALTVAYTPLRHRLRGFILVDALSVERFDDAWPPAVAATVSVEASGVTGHDLLWRPDGVGEVVYAKAGTVYGRYSRDMGRIWSVADSIGTGDDACQAIDYRRGLKLVGLYNEAGSSWSIVVGTWDETNDKWANWTSPAALASSAQPSAALTIRPDGIAEFDYTTTGGTRTTLRCRSFSSASTGTWT